MNPGSSRLVRSTPAMALAAALLLCLAALAGCGGSPSQEDGRGNGNNGGREIPLTTLAEGTVSDYGRIDEIPVPEDAPPECLAISEEEEFQRLLSLAYLQEPVPKVDFDAYVVIAAMQGPKNTGGYSIRVSRATQAGGEVTVEVEVIEPEPGAMVPQVLTSPYHLVLAERSSFDPRGELVFLFVDQRGQRISQLFAEV